jgi:hypothetical protein
MGGVGRYIWLPIASHLVHGGRGGIVPRAQAVDGHCPEIWPSSWKLIASSTAGLKCLSTYACVTVGNIHMRRLVLRHSRGLAATHSGAGGRMVSGTIKGSVYQTSDGYTRDPMIPSPPFRFRALGVLYGWRGEWVERASAQRQPRCQPWPRLSTRRLSAAQDYSNNSLFLWMQQSAVMCHYAPV